MKKQYLFSALALTALMAGCDYNDKYFDGLDELSAAKEVFTKEYTLTDADYATIASNSTNVAVAEAEGVKSELTNLKTTMRFSETLPASKYVPAFLASKWLGADDGSAVRVTFNNAVDMPDYLAAVESAEAYQLTDEDYANAWKDQPVYYFSPSKPAADYLPRVLAKSVSNPETGSYYTVQYAYSSVEPSLGGSDEPSYDAIADATAAAGDYTVKGTVAAVYARGFLMGDGTANILVYLNAPANVSAGDVVEVKGTTSKYAGLMQFPKESEITILGKAESYQAPAYEELDAAAMDAYLTAPVAKPVKYTGTLSISGSYYNINVEGTSKAVGSAQYPAPGMIDPALDGQKVTVYGYAIGVSSSKYVNTMTTKVVAEGTDRATVADVAWGETGDYSVQGAVVATYSRGFLLSDGTANILVYKSGTGCTVGDVVSVSGTTSTFGQCRQFQSSATVTVLTTGTTVKYPTPYEMTAEDMDAYVATEFPATYVRYVTYTGTLSISGNYYNVKIDGAVTAQGSLSYVESGMVDSELNGKKIVVTGYTIGTSSSKYVNTMVTSVEEATTATTRALAATRADVPTETRYAIYQYTSDGWTEGANMAIVNPSDYSKMGLSGNCFTTTYKPDAYLPAFLTLTYPYAQEGDTRAAVYFYGSEGTVNADEYIFTAGAWTKNNYTEEATQQFVLSEGEWRFNPSTTITLTVGKNQTLSATYYQTITDWVKENHPEFVTSYGNNDYYYGGSAYQNNFDFRTSAWKAYDAYANMSDDELTALMWERLPESFPHALEVLHADIAPIEGVDIIFTINFGVYDGTTNMYSIQYRVVAKGKFEYVEDSLQPIE